MTESDRSEEPDVEGVFTALAAAYVRGRCPGLAEAMTQAMTEAELLRQGEAAGLRLNRVKRTSDLPRVRAVLGAIRGIGPESLVDIGSGRGVFLWPLLDAFPHLAVTAIEPDARRRGHFEAVRDGGVGRLAVLGGDGKPLPLADASFDVVTILEVLEHQERPLPLAREAVRVARRFVIASVPLHPDDNPEHVHLFTAKTLRDLLATAGARSVRICPEPRRLLDNVALFREICRDAGCLEAPAPFASDHARFSYFRDPTSDGSHEPFDATRGELVLLCGMPGAGKDRWLERHSADAEVVSLDDLRESLDVAPDSDQTRVVVAAREAAKVALRGGRRLVWNATNVSRWIRRGIIDLGHDYGARIRIVYLEAPEATIRARLRRRERKVPEGVFARMLDRWEAPDATECHRLDLLVEDP